MKKGGKWSNKVLQKLSNTRYGYIGYIAWPRKEEVGAEGGRKLQGITNSQNYRFFGLVALSLQSYDPTVLFVIKRIWKV